MADSGTKGFLNYRRRNPSSSTRDWLNFDVFQFISGYRSLALMQSVGQQRDRLRIEWEQI
jgi:hypothetical protein